MSRHLSADQISEWVAGVRPVELVSHISECAECGSAAGEFEEALVRFRSDVHLRAAAASVPFIEPPQPARWFGFGVLAPRWVLAGAVVAVLAAVPVYRARYSAPAPGVLIEMTDAALLDQVDVQLARRVPGAMEPLAALAWNSPDELTNSDPRNE